MSATPDPTVAAAQSDATTSAQRFVADGITASYDERTDLMQNLRVTAEQLAKAEQEVRDAPGSYHSDEEAGR